MPEGTAGGSAGPSPQDDPTSAWAKRLGHLGTTPENDAGTRAITSAIEDGTDSVGARVQGGIGAIGGDGEKITITSSLLVVVGASIQRGARARVEANRPPKDRPT